MWLAGFGASKREEVAVQVMLVAGDTFRAAAADQLEGWANRSGALIQRPQSDRQRPDAVMSMALDRVGCSLHILPRSSQNLCNVLDAEICNSRCLPWTGLHAHLSPSESYCRSRVLERTFFFRRKRKAWKW